MYFDKKKFQCGLCLKICKSKGGLTQSRTQSNACSQVRGALALGKRNELCNFIGCGEINRCTPCACHPLRDFCGKYAWNKTHGVNGRKQIYRDNLSSLFE